MAQDPLKPKDNGKIKLPTVDGGMNKIAPESIRTGKKGAKGEDKGTPAEKKDKEDQEILSRIRKRLERCISAEAENRKDAVDDLKFTAGEQWPTQIQAERNFDRRPCLTINKLPTFIHQITNNQRLNRPDINVSPVGDRSDPEVAKMYRGLIRHIERESTADIAYDTGYQNSVTNGFGYWLLDTEWEKPDSFNQVICIKRIRNPFTVYLDPERLEPDGADSKFGFITELKTRSDFEEEWPWADPMSYSLAGVGENLKEWITSEKVRIANYYEISNKKRDLIALDNGFTGFKDELSDEVKTLIESGDIQVLRERETDIPTVMRYKVSGAQILERKVWPGKWIPIVQVIGDEVDIEGKVKLSGVVRHAKDSQRMYNYWKTSETELVALAPKAPWIMEEGQVEGHEQSWKNANVKSYPYLLYKGTSVNGTLAPPPQRNQLGGVPQGVVNAAQGASQDMQATTGIRFDASMNERFNDESGKAIRELGRMGDIGSFHYIDNLGRSLKHTGRQLIDLIPKIYDSKRMLTILREDGKEERIQIDPNAPKAMTESRNADTGKTLKIFNPTYGEYGCTVDIGPSYATKRIEASENMMAFAKAMPQAGMLIADLIAKNQDWPGAEEMATRLAKALPANLLTPDQKDVPPQIQAMLQNMQQQIQHLTLERQQMMKALNDTTADRALMQDKINKDFEAKLIGVIQKAEAAQQEHIGSQIKDLAEGVRSLMDTLSNPPANSQNGSAPSKADAPTRT